MSAGSGNTIPDQHTASGVVGFPQYPHEGFLAHEAALYKEQVDARLAASKLLAVANGFDPPSVKFIVDVDLSMLPALPSTHKEYERRLEKRTQIIAQNQSNEEKRSTLRFEAWTEVYSLFKTSTELTNPILSRSLLQSCDLDKIHGMHGGYFDGPLAYRMVVNELGGNERTEADKAFYRSAEHLQRTTQLPDGCTGAEYAKKALAYIHHIIPHLPHTTEPDDITQYLIGLMPKALRADGRRIKNELVQEGKQHEFMHVIKKCKALVVEEQKGNVKTPALVLSPEMLGFDLVALENSTGMHLALPEGMQMGTVTSYIATDGTKKWCANCPHGPSGCFENPAYDSVA